jgi:hypothetical protein
MGLVFGNGLHFGDCVEILSSGKNVKYVSSAAALESGVGLI